MKLILVGDSTVAPGSGWGSSFCAEHVAPPTACINMAIGGESSASYRRRGSWDRVIQEVGRPGFTRTYVLIQFGHNDQPGKPGRSTDLRTEYPANLERYVRETREAGGIPVLVTPLTRRAFIAGRLTNDLWRWAQAMTSVAAATRTPLVDLNRVSAEAVQQRGPLGSAEFAGSPPSGDMVAALQSGTSPTTLIPTSRADQAAGRFNFDYTHLGPAGSAFFSSMVEAQLKIAVPFLRGSLID